MRLKAWLACSLLCLQVVLAAAPASAKAAPDAPNPATAASEELPPWAGESTMGTAATGSYYGHSGLNPYQAYSSLPSDEIFIADTGMKMDQYLCRSGGPITFNVDIDRVYGAIAKLSGSETYNNLQNAQAAIANGLIAPYATLYMRVYDVDHDYQGGDYAPEVDQVSVNGRRLTRTLTSGNNRWDTVSFQVPIDWFLYPELAAIGSEPAKAPNEIRIDIDTANSDEVWCVEVDWAVLHIQAAKPAVLVNGILSNDGAWDTFRPLLWNRGLPNYAQELDATRGIFHNAGDLADAMPDIKKAFGVERMNIVAHSKGGLDSRAYLRTHSDIDTLVQLGTPNRGSDCAQSPLGNLLGSTWDLDPDWIFKNFNYRDTREWFWQPHNYVPNWTELGVAPIYIFAGTKFTTKKCPVGVGDDMDPPHDSVVSHDRATLPWNWNGVDGDGIDQGVTDATGPYDHSGVHEGDNVADHVVSWIAAKYSFTSSAASPGAMAMAQAEPAAVETQATAAATSTERLIVQEGARLAAGASAEWSFPLSGSALAQVAVIHGKATTAVQLTGPSGASVPASLTAVPAGMSMATVFNLDAPQAGTYKVRITAAADDFYTLEVRTLGGMDLQVKLAAETVAAGDAIGVTASLTDEAGALLTGAQVSASLYQPDGSSQAVALTEQPDGTYTGSLSSNAGGLHVVVVRSVKDGEQRSASATVAVIPPGATLGQPAETTTDTNADGLYNALVLTVPATLPQDGLYVLSGDLYDSQGRLIERQSVAKQATAGQSAFALAFDGQTIYNHGASGPYTLRDVVLSAVDLGGVPVAALAAPYTTQAYDAAKFQHARLQLLGGTDRGQDTDGDGLYNYLHVDLQFRAEAAGYYQASGRLVTQNGEELGWANRQVYLSGNGVLTLTFDGRQIRAGGTDGPYRLIDLMVQGPETTVLPTAYTTSPYPFRAFQSIGPDLTVVPERITTDPAPAAPGQTVTLSAVVENRGGNPTGSFPVAFYLGNPAQGGALIGQTQVAGVAAESEQTASVMWTTPAQVGSYEVYVVVNASRTVAEFDYSNNTSFQVFTLVPGDDNNPPTGDDAKYAAYLRDQVDKLAAEVEANYAAANKNGLLAKLRTVSDRVGKAEQALVDGKPSPTGFLEAAGNELGAFVNQLQAVDLPATLRTEWSDKAEELIGKIEAFQAKLK